VHKACQLNDLNRIALCEVSSILGGALSSIKRYTNGVAGMNENLKLLVSYNLCT
jgi:hypothetical protein